MSDGGTEPKIRLALKDVQPIYIKKETHARFKWFVLNKFPKDTRMWEIADDMVNEALTEYECPTWDEIQQMMPPDPPQE